MTSVLTDRPSSPAAPTPARHRWWQHPRALVGLLSLAALLYVMAPTGLQVGLENRRGALRNTVTQSDTPLAFVQGADLANIPAVLDAWAQLGDKPLVISYHDIALIGTSTYSVTPEAFAQQMALLEAMQVHALTSSEFRAYTEGAKVPPRSIMITFDDGARGVYRFADRILAQHNFHAVAFIITGFVGTRAPYYMTWKELDALALTGRWDFEAHTNVGHTKIPVDAIGTTGSYISNLEWIPAKSRLETVAEQRLRIETDLDICIKELASRGYGQGRLFAFPFSDYGAPSNNPEVGPVLLAVTSARFSSVFTDDVKPHPLAGPFQFNRLSISKEVTNTSLLANLSEAIDLTKKSPDGIAPTGYTTSS